MLSEKTKVYFKDGRTPLEFISTPEAIVKTNLHHEGTIYWISVGDRTKPGFHQVIIPMQAIHHIEEELFELPDVVEIPCSHVWMTEQSK
jgi:hypothetical protein